MSHTQLRNNPYKVAIASMVGTAIEFYDYYIYAAAAVLVFNTQFFPKTKLPVLSCRCPRWRWRFWRAPSALRCSATSAIKSAAKKLWWPHC